MPDSFDSSANLFLIGYRGSGKSAVAEILARELGRPWTDADALLEVRQGRTIAEIFAEDGEAGFRQIEAELLEELCRCKQHIVATGGGVILRAANRDRLIGRGDVARKVQVTAGREAARGHDVARRVLGHRARVGKARRAAGGPAVVDVEGRASQRR